jgi:predicted aminopeptidase
VRVSLATNTMLVLKRALLLLAPLMLSACAGLGPGYYWQAAQGQMALARKAQPIETVLADPATTPEMRARLELVEQIRSYATRELGLPDNDSYRSYADIGRTSVVWNVYANPPLSMEPRTWCPPVVGCVGYLGFFSEEAARARANALKAEGLDTLVGSVPAYSTLGWFADSVLSTFVNWPESDLAQLLFHELSHQLIYAKGDTEFNESFASTVEQVGVRRWLTQYGKQGAITRLALVERMSADFATLVLKHRELLIAIYKGPGTDAEKLERKRLQIEAMRAEYQTIKAERWGGVPGYDRWFVQEINNATFASVGFYRGLVPGFMALLKTQGDDLAKFYAEVRRLATLTPAERRAALKVSEAEVAANAAKSSLGQF